MIELKGRVSGYEAVHADIVKLEARIHDELKGAVERAVERCLAIANANLNGGVLHQRTGRLAASLTAQFHESGKALWSKLGAMDYVGRFWERGFNGDQHVKGHWRRIKHGPAMAVVKVSRRGKVRATKRYATGASWIREHDRRTDGTPRPWLSPALEAVRHQFREDVRKILETAGHGT
jgi:hypothetical protein